jgi:hypothetical protein
MSKLYVLYSLSQRSLCKKNMDCGDREVKQIGRDIPTVFATQLLCL